jgi:hypothetical protein
MPKAPLDYPARFPIDFGDIDPSVRQKIVQLYTADGAKARAILYLPAQGNPRTVVLMCHPRADFAQHYTIPFWLDAGFAACALNTRHLNNDAMMLHENLLLDIAAAMRFLREEEGFAHVVMLGNSGGGSLSAYSDAQARAPAGARVASPPGGGPPDLNRFDLPAADGLILLAAHPGQGMVLMGSIDPAVADEHDPFATDPELDMYDERNGYRPPPDPSRYSRPWLERYRAAQRARVARLDAIARGALADAERARTASKAADFASAAPAARSDMRRHAMSPHMMVIYRTQANPAYLDLTIDPSEREPGSIFSPRPDLHNYHAFGLARVVTPAAWLSTWSALSSHANLMRNLPAVTAPTLVVGAMADQDIFIADAQAEFAASGAADKSLEMIEGADHFMRAGGKRAHLGDPRPRLMRLLCGWTRDRFPC